MKATGALASLRVLLLSELPEMTPVRAEEKSLCQIYRSDEQQLLRSGKKQEEVGN